MKFKNSFSVSLLITAIIVSNLFFLLPSETLALVVNNSGGSNPPPTNTTPLYNVSNPPPTNTPQNSNTTANAAIITAVIPTYANGRWDENTLLDQFNEYGIDLGSNTRLYGLGNFAITGAVALKKTVDYYTSAVRGSKVSLSNLKVRAGTETYPSDQPVLDIDSDANLDYFIQHMATSRGSTSNGDLYQLGDNYFFKNNNYWHIVFGPSNGAFVKNTINFFGIVRDNFSVAHPFINESNTPSLISFPRNLTIGYRGQDVHDLQMLLNTDPYTLIAASGDGSPGHETDYFGAKTKNAVERYQYKNNEILDAAAVSAPTGFFGEFSRGSMTAYGNYLNALKMSQNRAALQYPTPTKPLEDIPLNAPAPANPASDQTHTNDNTPPPVPVISVVPPPPTAPPYDFTNGPFNPYAGSSTDPIFPPNPAQPPTLNTTPVFDQPGYTGIQDPNIAVNQTPNSSESSPASSLTSLVPTIFSVMQVLKNGGFSLPGFGPKAPGSNGAPGATGLPDFGGETLYNSALFPGDKYRPCGASPGINFVINDNTKSSTKIPSPIGLLQDSASVIVGGGTLQPGACVLGKFIPGGACMSWVYRGNTDVQVPGLGEEPQAYLTHPSISGIIKNVESKANSCS